MKVLHPHRISGEILDVIYEAKQRLVIVSPYVNFNNWRQMADALTNALKRGVKIDFFVRSDADNANSWEQVEQLGIVPKLVDNLHAKFYLSEQTGVISSMNLLSFSNSNSIEIGCKLETREELVELNRFVNDFLATNEIEEKPTEEDLYISREKFTVVLTNFIQNQTGSKASVYFRNGAFVIQALSNQFFLYIDKATNTIDVDAIVSGKEADCFHRFQFHESVTNAFDVELYRGKDNYYDQVGASYKTRLSSIYLDKLRVSEKKDLINGIGAFLMEIDKFKQFVYQLN